MPDLLPLEMLLNGQWADVDSVYGEAAWVGRLEELGLRSGSRLQVLQCGEPCLLQVGGTPLSIRGDAAMQILVRPLNNITE